MNKKVTNSPVQLHVLLISPGSLMHEGASTGRRHGGAPCIADFLGLRGLPGVPWVWLAGLGQPVVWVTLGKVRYSFGFVTFCESSL